MIICHPYRFVFIKTRKTASSSVEIALSRACGPGDVVTPLVAHLGEETLRQEEGGYGPDGYLKTGSEYTLRDWRKRLLRGRHAQRYKGLMTAPAIRDAVSESVWSTYCKVSIERNPWDRALSRYWWNQYRWEREGKWQFSGLTDFLRYLEAEKPEQLSNWSAYTIDDEVVVDHMLHYETLSADLQALSQRLNIREDISLPRSRAKGGYRKEKKHYSQVLTPEDRAIIDRACAREIRYFGYRFGD